MEHLPGPDFPTGGIIYGTSKSVRLTRPVEVFTSVEKRASKQSKTATHQVNKAQLVEKIAVLVREKRLEGVSDIETSRTVTVCGSLSNASVTHSVSYPNQLYH